jgi:hypothetical protein
MLLDGLLDIPGATEAFGEGHKISLAETDSFPTFRFYRNFAF